MLSRLKRRLKGDPPVVEHDGVHFTPEHAKLSRSLRTRHRLFGLFWSRIGLIRFALFLAGTLWLLALPYEGLWKGTYIDEHALQPSQVTVYYDWANVHAADRYLETLESLVDAPREIRQGYLVEAFLDAGLDANATASAVWAHVEPPRSAGTEVILLTANWVSREGGPNLRGIAMILSLAEFLRGQTWWAFDIVLVVGEGYLDGLDTFMMEDYNTLFPGLVWNALNVDYPGHSFEHIGLFYEGVNGRLPNQDVVNSVAHIARWAGGVHSIRLHDIEDSPVPSGPFLQPYLGNYLVAAKHLLEHAKYMAFGRPSGAHGVLARHRIDALTVYCPNATGPHGFHSLGRTIESSLRTFNNLLERLHASYFFYLLPKPDKFIPVGHYLPAAILLGASVTLGGFDCPDAVDGIIHVVTAFTAALALGAIPWLTGSILPYNILAAIPFQKRLGPSRKSTLAIAHLIYGALIPTLAMVNFPQAILLAYISLAFLVPDKWRMFRIIANALHPFFFAGQLLLKEEWESVGNFTWPAIFVVWMPLAIIAGVW